MTPHLRTSTRIAAALPGWLLDALCVLAARPTRAQRWAADVVHMAWAAAVCGETAMASAAVTELGELGPRAVRALVDRIADELIDIHAAGDARWRDAHRYDVVTEYVGDHTHPADLWLAAVVTARAVGDYRGVTALVTEAGDRLPEWTRRGLYTAARTVAHLRVTT